MKIKVFVDGRAFDTEYQGTRTYIQNLYAQIDQINEVEIFLASEDPQNASTFFPQNSKINFLKYSEGNKLSRILYGIPNIISKYKIDVAHFQYICPPIKNCKHLVTIHDVLFKDFTREFSFRYRLTKSALFYYSAKHADILTTVSEYSQTAISVHFNTRPEKIKVIPNGVADIYFESYNKLQSKAIVFDKFRISNYILYVSRIEPRKNQLILLKAFLELKLYLNQSLVFVGKKSINVPEIDEIISTLPTSTSSRIFFLENVGDSDLRLIYQGSDLCVYPSKAEGFGIPPLESAALKIPTICSNMTAMADFTFFGQNHIYPNVNNLKQAIKNVANNEIFLNEISNHIKKTFTWKESALLLNSLLTGN